MIPAYAICFFKDGEAWCCVMGDFVSLAESDAGFGGTMDSAMRNLHASTLSSKGTSS